MAPNKKKKKKPTSNPARGFATVSTPSKKVDDSPPEAEDGSEVPSINGKHASAEKNGQRHVGLESGASDLQHMTPEELEQHLEEAELQSILDVHGQRSKRDVSRQVARLETERRGLRQSGMMLETEGWLHDVLDEILELVTPFPSDLKTTKTAEEPFNDTDLCVKLWTVQETLQSLNFRNVEAVQRHLIKISSVIAEPGSNSMIWGLDEALDWLAIHSDPKDLPGYQQLIPRYTSSASRPRSPASSHTSGETIENSDSAVNHSRNYSPSVDDAGQTASLSMPISHGKNQASNDIPATPVFEESDDDDPDQLTDRYLSARYELLKGSLGNNGSQQEQLATDQQANRLRQRIQRIERDVLFDRDEAMVRWPQIKSDLEVEQARSNALADRQKRPDRTATPTENYAVNDDFEESRSTANSDAVGEDLFGNIFASGGNDHGDSDAAATVAITVKDFGPLGAGANPRKALEDVCKAR
jgi:ATP-dependent RNA helicase DHX29